MSILHLTTEGRLEYSPKRLTFTPDQATEQTLHWPTAKVSQIIMEPHCRLNIGDLAHLQAEQIQISVPELPYYALNKGLPEVRTLQGYLWHTPDLRFEWAKQLIRCKLYASAQVFPELKRKFILYRKALQHAQTSAHILSLEAYTARLFYKHIYQLYQAKHPELAFCKRLYRPSPDPVNALISLTNALLANKIEQRIMQSGLDPYIGILHTPSAARPALVWDLIEVWRPSLMSWINQMFAEGILSLQDFQFNQKTQACRLKKSAHRRFYPRWNMWVNAHKTPLHQHVLHYRKKLTLLSVYQANQG